MTREQIEKGVLLLDISKQAEGYFDRLIEAAKPLHSDNSRLRAMTKMFEDDFTEFQEHCQRLKEKVLTKLENEFKKL